MTAAEPHGGPRNRHRAGRLNGAASRASMLPSTAAYMLADRKDHPCRSVSISPGNLTLAAPVIGAIGERVVCHFAAAGAPRKGKYRAPTCRMASPMSMITSRRAAPASGPIQLNLAGQPRRARGLADERGRLSGWCRQSGSVFITLADGQRLKGRVLDLSPHRRRPHGFRRASCLERCSPSARRARAWYARPRRRSAFISMKPFPADVFNEDIRL